MVDEIHNGCIHDPCLQCLGRGPVVPIPGAFRNLQPRHSSAETGRGSVQVGPGPNTEQLPDQQGIQDLADARAHDINELLCHRCGSSQLHIRGWIELNTGEVVSTMNDGTLWCSGCETSGATTMQRWDYERQDEKYRCPNCNSDDVRLEVLCDPNTKEVTTPIDEAISDSSGICNSCDTVATLARR